MRTLALTTLVFLWGLSPLFAATSIERIIEADEFSGLGTGARAASGGVCGGLTQTLKTGDAIRIVADERGARRDERAVSFLLDARSHRMLVVDHTSQTFAELRVPLDQKALFPFKARLDKEARQIMSFSLDGPAKEIQGKGTVTYQGKFTLMGREFDGNVTCRPTASAGARPLVLLEQAVQQLRGAGNDWVSLLPTKECLILGFETAAHLPEVQVRSREKLVKVEETESAKLVLTAPEGYRKVPYRGCRGFAAP
jgi:hypothetical protein